MLRRKQFSVNVLTNAGGNAVNSALQLLLLLLLARLLPTPVFAAFVTARTIVALGETASDYGARLWAVREFTTSENPRQILLRSVLCKLFYTACAMAVLACLPLNSLTPADFVLSTLVAITQPGTDPLLWYLRGRDRLDIEAVLVLFNRVLIFAALGLAAWLEAGVSTLLLVWLALNLVRLLSEAVAPVMQPLFARGAIDKPSATDLIRTLVDVFPIGTSLFLTTLFYRAGILLLDVFGTPEDVAVFGTGFQLVTAAGFVGTSVCVASFSPLVQAVQSQDPDAVRSIISRTLVLTTLIFVPLCFLGIWISVPVADRFLPDRFSGTGETMVLLMPGLYLSCINMGLRFTLTAFALNWQDVLIVLLGIASLTAFTLFYGADSWPFVAAVGWVLGEAVVLISRMSLLLHYHRQAGIPLRLIASTTVLLTVAVRQLFW
ncbi:MAG: hypothetical protein R3C19_11815 [Planctomycetaceae bacterium]